MKPAKSEYLIAGDDFFDGERGAMARGKLNGGLRPDGTFEMEMEFGFGQCVDDSREAR